MAFAMVAVFSLTFVSCGSDGDEPGGGTGSIIGTWRWDLNWNFEDIDHVKEAHAYGYYRFKEDGTVSIATVQIVKFDSEGKAEGLEDITEVETLSGTYKINGNKISTTTHEGELESGEYKVSGDKLTITATDEEGFKITIPFTKVSDSEMDQYLKK